MNNPKRLEIHNAIEKTESFLTLNSAFLKFYSLTKDKNVNLESFLKYINKDVLLSSVVLKNTSSNSDKIITLKKIAKMIGESSIKNMFPEKIMEDCFQNSKKDDWEDLWKHSLGVAITSKIVCKYSSYSEKYEELYLAGLLHDLGAFFLKQNFSDDYKQILKLIKSDPNKRLLFAEKKILGTTHSEVGALLAKKWNFPKTIINVIKHHHYIDLSMDNKEEIAIVMIANNIAKGMRFGKSDNYFIEPVPDWVWRYLQLEQGKYYRMISDIQDEFDASTAFTK